MQMQAIRMSGMTKQEKEMREEPENLRRGNTEMQGEAVMNDDDDDDDVDKRAVYHGGGADGAVRRRQSRCNQGVLKAAETLIENQQSIN
jgi:hypothetical protein